MIGLHARRSVIRAKVPPMASAPRRISAKRLWFPVAATAVVTAHAVMAFYQVARLMTRGHNGFNSAAYMLAARNSLRFDAIFPLQYYTGIASPDLSSGYTHHPLGMHAHNTLAMWLFGDHEATVRSVAALHSVLVTIALIVVVARLWGKPSGLLAGATYTVLPIVAIYVNMANHVSGYTFWILLFLYAYTRYCSLRTRGWLVALLGAFAFAAFWDWPANYAALMVAAHWFAQNIRHPSARRWGHLALYCGVVLAMFGGHLALTHYYGGGLDELMHTADARQGDGGGADQFLQHLKLVPPLMFTLPVLALTAGWFAAQLVAIVRRRFELRNLIPMVMLVCGALHFTLFKASAYVHSFWGWYSCGAIAIIWATTMIALGQKVAAFAMAHVSGHRARLGMALTAAVALLSLTPLVLRTTELFHPSRRVGGAMWFVAPIRGPIASYESGYDALSFAHAVRARTTRRTGVYVDRSIYQLAPEPRWFATLDRQTRDVSALPTRPIEGPTHGWVYVARAQRLRTDRIRQLAEEHSVLQLGDFIMVDLRPGAAPGLEIIELREVPAPWWYRYLYGPDEPRIHPTALSE